GCCPSRVIIRVARPALHESKRGPEPVGGTRDRKTPPSQPTHSRLGSPGGKTRACTSAWTDSPRGTATALTSRLPATSVATVSSRRYRAADQSLVPATVAQAAAPPT